MNYKQRVSKFYYLYQSYLYLSLKIFMHYQRENRLCYEISQLINSNLLQFLYRHFSTFYMLWCDDLYLQSKSDVTELV